MIRGGLFSRYFLEDGIRQTDAYRSLDPGDMAARLGELWNNLAAMKRPNEAETIQLFIEPALVLLGWHYLKEQKTSKDRTHIADALLFLDATDKQAATRLTSAERFKRGVMVVEHEARDTLLDRENAIKETPSSQILRYMRHAAQITDGALRWGLLTNGRFWRLYWERAGSRAEGFIELELPGILGDLPPKIPGGAPDDHWLRVFLLLFRAEALRQLGPGEPIFLDRALADGRHYQEKVTAALSEIVFDRVFPNLVAAIGAHDPQARIADADWREDAREAALRLLFRLLFLLYAEDRDLLPLTHPGYLPYSLRGLRDEAAKVTDQHLTLSARAQTWWPKLQALFGAISDGDSGMGLPPYNGGLFHDAPGAVLVRLRLPDAVLAPLLDAMSREEIAGTRRWINYRDLSVQHLGSIYERLLERDVVPDGAGGVALRPNAFARKTTGSYYTPDELVQLILRRAVGPLLAERRAAFAAKAETLKSDTRAKKDRLTQLTLLDPAERFLDLRICDPAMGSGHFLVSLVDYLTDQTIEAMAEKPDWAAEYRSPLLDRIASIRARIKQQADGNGWPVREEHLDDKHIIRRIILKRCVYGVDLNPMAVELAKLALWLHSFTVGAPLSFLDHHLRCGDSLFGEFVGAVERDLRARYGLVMSHAVVAARNAAKGMALVEEQTDADIAEVQASAAGFAAVEQDTAALRGFLDLYHASAWLGETDPAGEAGRAILFGGGYGDPVSIGEFGGMMRVPQNDAADIKRKGNKPPIRARDAYDAAHDFVTAARNLAQQRRFLHWEAAFPGLWDNWEHLRPTGGFHAVIGNPPWDRMKMQEVEWFAARVPAIAGATRAADRKRAVKALRDAGDPVAAEYDLASWTTEAAARVVRQIGVRAPKPEPEDAAYPLLSGGDVNLYSLMVERAARLVRADGIVGVLVPSGIAADLGAAPFFRSLSTSGRLAALLDFENGSGIDGPFFPDVHRSFKFSSLIFGGRDREFPAAACAFFKQSAEAAEREAFVLTPDDFAAVNPNTGTAPIFRSQRDADITKGIYARVPVLVDRRTIPPTSVWPVRYLRMLDMTNDSAKFRTVAELQKLGAYEVKNGRWEKGAAKWVPLYEGKMVQAYDHRAASVVVNAANVNRPAQPETSTFAQHADPNWLPTPQFFVQKSEVDECIRNEWLIGYKMITAPTNSRTFIAAMLPVSGVGNSMGVMLPRSDPAAFSPDAVLILGNLNSMAFDFVTRQKIQGQNINWYIVEQLPMIPQPTYAHRFGPKTAEQIIRDDVLALTYTAHDMAQFAADQGYTGPPFPWEPEDRLRRRARLDAVFFHLYGLDRDDAGYVMDTFPIVRAQETALYGRYKSRALVLNYMAALAAGNPDADVVG